MSCSRPREIIEPYFDGELLGPERDDVAEHLRTCSVCARHLRELQRLRRELSAAGGMRAPAGLAERIRADIAAQAASAPQAPEIRQPGRFARWSRQVARLAAAMLIGAALTWGLMSRSAIQASLAHDILAAHLRSLAQEATVQIASSDRHAVKPWFTGRLDFSPNVKDLTAEGFPLVGGRLDYIGDRRVAVVVFKRRQHVINVFMRPPDSVIDGGGAAAPVANSEKGFNSLRWMVGGIEHWAISDLNASELAQFQKLF